MSNISVDHSFTFAESVFPTAAARREQLKSMAMESKQVLSQMAANLSSTILNYKPIDVHLRIGKLCYIPDRFVRKQGVTVMRGLGKIIAISGNNYSILT